MIKQHLNGFTLVELLIAVAIMGILASIATSFYGDNVKKSKCTEGRTAVLERSASLGKCLAIYGAYDNTNCNITLGNTTGGNFNLGLVKAATTFTLTSTWTGGVSASTNPFCTTITLDNLGVQGGTGTAPW